MGSAYAGGYLQEPKFYPCYCFSGMTDE
jgi:hypothetical protein